LKTIYESEKSARFSTPEVRMASHILVNFGADKAAAKKKADDIYTQLKGGADFAALAKTSSDDSGSKTKGGDLGAIKRGDGVLPQKFEAALFAMAKAGDITEPVETEFGWHIIRLNELKPARVQAFEEADVQKTLIDLYQQTEAQKHFQEKNAKLEELAFDNPTGLDPVAKALELKVETTDWFTRGGGAGILANAAVITAAFSPEVLTSNENSKPIAIDAGHVIVIRKAEYEAPRQKTLAEVDAMVRDELKSEMASAKAQADADAALAALKTGQAMDVVAKTSGQTVQAPGASARDRADLSKPLLAALFKLPHPSADKPSLGETKLEHGEIAVMALTAVKDGTSTKPGDDPKNSQTALRDARAGSEFAAYRVALEKRISVDVKPLPKDEALAP
jgi:peptidyl-prolyl cis-trans isomerase D